ncbi:MAG: CHASE2 domain-containing protein [Spirochaetales bacterium]|jgi:adenylate cyclase|nr:CHASE2 domain-containing protein [Spirochaetales bacterium]
MTGWKNALIGLVAGLFFAILTLTGFMGPLEEKIYDLALRVRRPRPRIDNVVLLDMDDQAIAYNGVFPWPRSVTAEGLLRLKEYGARLAIFDVEFIDKGPQGVDTIYLNQGLPLDFDRSFSEISGYVSELFQALSSGRLGAEESARAAGELSSLIVQEKNRLLARSQSVARDNDEYLAQAAALLGTAWMTLNLREAPLSEDQAAREELAQQLFSYPVKAQTNFPENYVDVLPALPLLARTAQGAGFTNVSMDSDGVRRRISLAQKVKDHWYLQLAFSPLINYLGRPEIELFPRRLVIRGAKLPTGGRFATGEMTKDISIPLDASGRMLLDWPPENYEDSFSHLSFIYFSLLSDLEDQMRQYLLNLNDSSLLWFFQFFPELSEGPAVFYRLLENLDASAAAKERALQETSEEDFLTYTALREESRSLIRLFEEWEVERKVNQAAFWLGEENPGEKNIIDEEAGYVSTLLEYLITALNQYEEIETRVREGVQDKFCILGLVATGTTDFGVTPFSEKYANVGTHAVVLDTILSESFIRPLPAYWNLFLCLLVTPAFFFFSGRLSPVLRTILGFAAIAAVASFALILFRLAGAYLNFTGPVFSLVAGVFAREIISYSGSEKEKRFYRKAFATYTSEAVADQIARNPALLQLGGTKREMSAIFTDIQGFSTISEKLTPEELVRLLNHYLTAMSDVILEELGTIDKYEGDAIIAFFGAPLEQPDHALRACRAALSMKRIERELNKTVVTENLSPAPLLTRIGLNTGDMVAGNMGTEKKMNYTIMGDAVNLAARLEGVNKQYGTWILMSETTAAETGDAFLLRRLDRVRVVGKSRPVQLFELVESREGAGPAEREKVERFHQALDDFGGQNWTKALAGFKEIQKLDPADGPAKVYQRRCETYLTEPPAPGWEGVYNLTEK